MSNSFALKEVLDFTVETYSATATRGAILFSVPYASETTISTKATRLPISGGQGNYKIMDLDYGKDITYKATLPLVDMQVLATKLGRTVATGAVSTAKKEILTANASNTITLSKGAPTTGSLKIYLLSGSKDLGVEQTVGTPATTPNTYSIATATVTLNATTAPVGTQFIVFYSYTSGITATDLKFTANDFPAFIRITGIGLGVDDFTGKTVPMAFDVKKAKVTCDFDLTMSSTKATELAFECNCYPVLDADGVSKVFVEMIKLNDEAF